jgi:DNA/RNA-binding domain of Phe-tRNA-synthetase-like protein
MQVHVSAAWRQAFPDAHAGVVLVEQAPNSARGDALDRHLIDLEVRLRQRHAGVDRAALASLPTMVAYQNHYRAFGQTYHLLGQLESVVLKGRPLKSPGGALVTAMFAAEIDNLLLTAAHDADVLVGDLELDCARPGEEFVGIGGRAQVLKAGDMLMRDGRGVISAVLAGPDPRTRIQPTTTRAVYVTYAPAGISSLALRQHHDDIVTLVRLAQPDARAGDAAIYPAAS